MSVLLMMLMHRVVLLTTTTIRCRLAVSLIIGLFVLALVLLLKEIADVLLIYGLCCLMIGSFLLHHWRIRRSLLNRLSLGVGNVRVVMNIAVWIGGFVVHHHLGLGCLNTV